MTNRNEMIAAVRDAIAKGNVDSSGNPIGECKLPAPPVVWPILGTPPTELLTAFETNLKVVTGELVVCKDESALISSLATSLREVAQDKNADPRELGFRWGIFDESFRPLVDAVIQKWNAGGMSESLDPCYPPNDPATATGEMVVSMGASIVRAEYLLADTGSAVIRATSAFERLLCYLSPVCFVVAKLSTIREHLPHAWSEITERMTETKGEFLIVTGPSRTADIEKILVLGVHGPRLLRIFVVDDLS